MFRKACQISFFVLLSAAPAIARDIIRPQPEIATGHGEVSVAKGSDFMIVTANPHATRAGYDILERGGSAADAAIAAQLVLGLSEPQSSGLGGGAFALYYDAKSGKLTTLDGRETAPALAGPYLFFENGAPVKFKEAVLGGRSVGVPGTPALLQTLHESYGKLTWMELFEEAIKLAEEGFEISPRLRRMIDASSDDLARFPDTADYFLRDGDTLVNEAYAKTLKDMAFSGGDIFFSGDLPKKIAAKVQAVEGNPGLLQNSDFVAYSIIKRDPVCGPYRAYIVCSMGEPSSGALTILQILGMLEHFDLPTLGADSPESWHAIAAASRLAFADRAAYMADPGFVNTPGEHLIDPAYLKSRAALIGDAAPGQASAGTPPDWSGPLYASDDMPERSGTTHISIVDKAGNIISMTSTIEGAFGSHLMAGGFLLNNELTDFAFAPYDEAGNPKANMAQGGKRPRSSMSPTIVFNQSGVPVLVIGSAGGSRIISYVLTRIIATLDWGISIEDALAMPNFTGHRDVVESENNPVHQEMTGIGYKVENKDLNSGLTAIQITNGIYTGAADPRREGLASGR